MARMSENVALLHDILHASNHGLPPSIAWDTYDIQWTWKQRRFVLNHP